MINISITVTNSSSTPCPWTRYRTRVSPPSGCSQTADGSHSLAFTGGNASVLESGPATSCPGRVPPVAGQFSWGKKLDHISFQTSILHLTKAFKLKSQDFVKFILWQDNGSRSQRRGLGGRLSFPHPCQKKGIRNNSPSLGMDSSTPCPRS